MDPYKILELNGDNITKEEIKKAYRRLILIYHPDKNKDTDTTEKFKEIQTAYEILINDERKKEYDNLPEFDKSKYYDTVKELITKKYPNIKDYLNSFIKNFYNNCEDNFKKDLENFDYDPVVFFKNKTICVTGEVSVYKDKPQIVVNSPKQLVVKE